MATPLRKQSDILQLANLRAFMERSAPGNNLMHWISSSSPAWRLGRRRGF
jgi:hypothetical protein